MVKAEVALEVDMVEACPLWRGHEEALRRALSAAAASERRDGEVSLLLGDDAAVAELNQQFRGKSAATNVLSFPAADGMGGGFLGDIALAAETIAREADVQGKRFEDHAAHLAVHGFLHLLGYDHESDADAEIMEQKERDILRQLGIADPYA